MLMLRLCRAEKTLRFFPETLDIPSVAMYSYTHERTTRNCPRTSLGPRVPCCVLRHRPRRSNLGCTTRLRIPTPQSKRQMVRQEGGEGNFSPLFAFPFYLLRNYERPTTNPQTRTQTEKRNSTLQRISRGTSTTSN